MRIVENIHSVSHWAYRKRIPLLPSLLKGVLRIAFGLVLPPSVVLGRNVLIGYQGLGTVIHAETVIGDNVKVGTNVTIGGRSGRRGVAVIDDDAEIGTGARLLGPIHVGRGARIGANAVVLTDVPPGAVFAGVPAREIRASTLPREVSDVRVGVDSEQ